jgi:hypothetical protein
MGYFRFDVWELILHVLGITLWCMTILYLIKDRMSRDRNTHGQDHKENLGDFDQQIQFQMLKQQAEKALETLSETISRECRMLQDLMDKGDIGRETGGLRVVKRKLAPHPRAQYRETPHGGNSVSEANPHDEVLRLTELGMSEQEISQRVKIPKSEVSLIRKLNCNQESHVRNPRRSEVPS